MGIKWGVPDQKSQERGRETVTSFLLCSSFRLPWSFESLPRLSVLQLKTHTLRLLYIYNVQLS